MEALFIVGLISGVVALIVKAVQGYNRQITEAWSDAARQLGMSFTPGSILKSKTIRGRMYENRVEVDTFRRSSGKNSQVFTRYRIHYPEALGLGLHLKQQGFFSGVAAFFGSQDIEVGDAQFDPKVLVKGANPRRVVEFLTPSRRLRILRLFQAFPECEIKDPLIEFCRQGNEKQADPIVTTVRRLSFAATRLCAGTESGRALDQALEAQRDGRLDDALQHVRETSRIGDEADPDVQLLEGQILEAGGRRDEAAAVFERARREHPDDRELNEWAPREPAVPDVEPDSPPVVPMPEPPPVVPAPESPPIVPEPEPPVPEAEVETAEPVTETVPAPVDEPVPTESATVAAASDGDLEAATVCEDLFASKRMSFDVRRRFDSHYKNRSVSWSGGLRQVSSFRIDMIFTGSSGTRAVFDLHEVPGGAFGRTAQAIVQLPEEALKKLRSRIGDQIAFQGRLVSCDALMHNLFVADADLI